MGISAGGGYAQSAVGGPYGIVLLPTLSLHLPIRPDLELELWLPWINMLLGVNTGASSAFWSDVFVKWHPIRQALGLFLEPGLGLMYLRESNYNGGAPYQGVAIELPVRLGYEIMSARRIVGVSFAIRPWLDILVPLGPRIVGESYGFFLEMDLVFYVTRRGR